MLHKWLPRRFNLKLYPKIQQEIERLLKAGFIRLVRYVEWLSNIAFVIKKNSQVRVCIDFRNLNLITLKDEYAMPITNMLIDTTSSHGILTFMDGYSGYNQIFVAEFDIHRTTFKWPDALVIYKWIVIPFNLKNIGATYQRVMNDLIGKNMEVYIDVVVVKSNDIDQHLVDLEQAFIRMRLHNLKMKLAKCAIRVLAGNFLDFFVCYQGIKMDKNKTKVILEVRPP